MIHSWCRVIYEKLTSTKVNRNAVYDSNGFISNWLDTANLVHLPLLSNRLLIISWCEEILSVALKTVLFKLLPILPQEPFYQNSIPQLNYKTLESSQLCGVFRSSLLKTKNNIKFKRLDEEWRNKIVLNGFEASTIKACSSHLKMEASQV